MAKATRWPIDCEQLAKGDVIPIERIEMVTEKNYPSQEYQLALLALKQDLEKRMYDLGRPVTIKQERGALRILKDDEASEYNYVLFDQHVKGLVRRHRMNCLVDVSQMNETMKNAHRRRLAIEGCVIQAVSDACQTLQLPVHKRRVPGLPAKA